MNMQANKFGDLLKKLRLEKEFPLREFCKLAQEDPANLSRIERGLKIPPNKDVLERQIFFDIADIARGEIPKDIISDEELVEKLPAFWGTMREDIPEKEVLNSFAEKIRKSLSSVIY